MKPALVAGLACLLLFTAATARSADTAAAKQQELNQLRARIATVQAGMDRDIQRRSAATLELRDTERQLAELAGGLRALNRKIGAAQSKLDALKRQQMRTQAALDAQKQALVEELRAAYLQGQDSELRLLLNAEDPASLDRLLTYFDYLNKARAARIQSVRAELATLARINNQVQQQVTELTRLRDHRSQTLAALQRARSVRQTLIANLNAKIRTRGEKLARLHQDEQSIETLLANLRQALSDIPADLEQTHRFSALKGRLLWPVAGRLARGFGAPMADGRLRAQGDLIAAPLGTPVRAISYGRVVYADWLPHFGLLIIIDHGDGYMSIYAHNQSLYTQVGDWVHAGDTIASLGDSGGQSQPGLYFEIRHRNTALDPRHWCRGHLPRG